MSNLPEMLPFNSSLLDEAGYDSEAKALFVRFASKTPQRVVYRYDSVPAHVWQDMQRAPSIGSYFLKHVKPYHTFQRLDGV